MEKENIFGKMEDFMKGNGKTTKCMGKDYFFGLMVRNTKVNMKMTKRMDLEFLLSKMGVNMREIGKTEFNKEEGLLRKIILLNKEYGKMERE